jgi:hypothetical protein
VKTRRERLHRERGLNDQKCQEQGNWMTQHGIPPVKFSMLVPRRRSV